MRIHLQQNQNLRLLNENPKGNESQKRNTIMSGCRKRGRDLNAGENIIAMSYLGQRKRTQDIQQDLVCRTGGARYQRDGAKTENVAPRCCWQH